MIKYKKNEILKYLSIIKQLFLLTLWAGFCIQNGWYEWESGMPLGDVYTLPALMVPQKII